MKRHWGGATFKFPHRFRIECHAAAPSVRLEDTGDVSGIPGFGQSQGQEDPGFLRIEVIGDQDTIFLQTAALKGAARARAG